MTKQPHTPTPWNGNISQPRGMPCVESVGLANGGHITALCPGPDGTANAAFIVRAVNNHTALIEAIERLLNYEDEAPPADSFGPEVYAKARAALAKAKES